MTYPGLDEELHEMAADPPDSASIRAAVGVGFARRQKRVRVVALLATAVAVIVIAGGISIAGKIGLSSSPAAATPEWQQHGRPVVIPQGSTLTPFSDDGQVVSPVAPTVDPPAADDTVFWQLDDSGLFVAWTFAAGPKSSAAPDLGSLQTPGGTPVERGYVINATEAIPGNGQGASSSAQSIAGSPSVPAPQRVSTTAVASTTSVSVAGHAATLTHRSDTAWVGIFGGDRWLTWELTDGRFAHAWVGGQDDKTLLAFAAGLLERPTVFARHVVVGVSLPGYTAEGIQELGHAGALDSASIYLCPVGTNDIFSSGAISACLNAAVYPGKGLSARETGSNQMVDVDGMSVQVGTGPKDGSLLLDRGLGVLVSGQQVEKLADLDIATLAASVRVDPSVSSGR
ncbi:hypothetical protein ABIB25_001585 [Nakamurella sp. UYEF19]|uniref:hypothetical protein n=1 Tax=Nakamurella sp. UYEF19 TaxID=1756392 RepID=UPI0033955244